MTEADRSDESSKALANSNEPPYFERDEERVCNRKKLWSKAGRKCRLWVVFFGCCSLHFIVFGMHYSFGAMFAKLLTKFRKGQEQTAWVGSLASASMFFWAVASLKLCDISSVSFTCLCGSVVAALGLILTSLARQFEVLYVSHSLLFGLGTSLMYTPSLVIIARYYGKYRSAATGIVVSCGSLGQLVLSPLLNFFTESHGVSFTFRWCGSAFAVLSVLSSLSFWLIERQREVQETPIFNASWSMTKRLFRNRAFILWILAMMICNFTYYIPLIHLSMYAEEIGASSQSSSLLLTAIAASAMFGRMVFGKISNLKPEITMPVYQLCMLISGTITLFSSMSTTFWHLVLYSIAYGFLDGSFIGLLSIVTMQIVGLEELAQGWSVMLFSIALPIALGPPTVGKCFSISQLNLLQKHVELHLTLTHTIKQISMY